MAFKITRVLQRHDTEGDSGTTSQNQPTREKQPIKECPSLGYQRHLLAGGQGFKPAEIHPNAIYGYPVLTLFWAVGVLVFSLVQGNFSLAWGVYTMAFTTAYAIPMAGLNYIQSGIRWMGGEKVTWAHPCAWMTVIGVHAITYGVGLCCILKIESNILRWWITTLQLQIHFKVQEALASMRIRSASIKKLRNGAEKEELKAKLFMDASPLTKAGVVLFTPNVIDELVPVDTPEKLNSMLKRFAFDYCKWTLFLLSIFTVVGYLQHEAGIDLLGTPVVSGYLHMVMVYPVVTMFIWIAHIITWIMIGSVPRAKWGNKPMMSRDLREFWGKRYNQVISDLGKKTIFLPMVNAGASEPVASFVVFIATGLLHAVPIYLIGGTPLEVAGQFIFFLIHWLICVLETKFVPRSGSILRSAIVFIAVYPIFGVSGSQAMSRVGFWFVPPKVVWDACFRWWVVPAVSLIV